eukprot:10524480-Ditylum_brightwellii.AAC.1
MAPHSQSLPPTSSAANGTQPTLPTSQHFFTQGSDRLATPLASNLPKSQHRPCALVVSWHYLKLIATLSGIL